MHVEVQNGIQIENNKQMDLISSLTIILKIL